jgi:hypothetical protein
LLTDRPPTNPTLVREFGQSDRLDTLDIPLDDNLVIPAQSIETAMRSENRKAVRMACTKFLVHASGFYQVTEPTVRVLAARPLRIREGGWGTELFGDYDPQSKLIRVWLRTAILKDVTSFGTFLSTLCHELCHHLDFELFGFHDSWHTRGFYERAAVLYHHARGTPKKQLFWIPQRHGQWQINWTRTNRGS